MARDKSLFKMLVNRLLDHLDGMAIGAELGSETGLAAELGASRTTVRAALGHLADAGVVSWDGRRKRLVRRPRTADRFDTAETRPQIARIEEPFLTWVLHGDLPPGTTFSE